MRDKRFTFLCNDEERKLIVALAEKLSRSQGDTIRFVLRTAAQDMQLELKPQSACPSNQVVNERQ